MVHFWLLGILGHINSKKINQILVAVRIWALKSDYLGSNLDPTIYPIYYYWQVIYLPWT